MKTIKRILIILGVLLILAGGVFFLQGMNVITVRSFMRNNPDWVLYGGAMVVVGVVLLAIVNRFRFPLKAISRVGAILLTILGILVVLAGLVWFLQGINVLPGSRMTGQIQWAINGGIAMVVGGVMIAIANRKRFRRRR